MVLVELPKATAPTRQHPSRLLNELFPTPVQIASCLIPGAPAFVLIELNSSDCVPLTGTAATILSNGDACRGEPTNTAR